jgi:hypothetical protein
MFCVLSTLKLCVVFSIHLRLELCIIVWFYFSFNLCSSFPTWICSCISFPTLVYSCFSFLVLLYLWFSLLTILGKCTFPSCLYSHFFFLALFAFFHFGSTLLVLFLPNFVCHSFKYMLVFPVHTFCFVSLLGKLINITDRLKAIIYNSSYLDHMQPLFILSSFPTPTM